MKEIRIKELNDFLVNKLKLTRKMDLRLINKALTHPSYIYEGNDSAGESNQRLEFLGDAVVGLVVAEYLFKELPRKTEGELTKMRAAIVCEASLAEAAKHLKLGDYLLLGKGEELMGGAERTSNLADCFEAFIGAVYLSVGLEKVRTLILSVLQDKIRSAVTGNLEDYKTQLQEYIQRCPENRLTYKILDEEGPDHNKTFRAAVYLNERELARGAGRTKKEAEQQAAGLALKSMEGS